MQNLQNLLRMPYGCGEQNIVLFTNIYVLNYLNETGQLTEKIKSKAISCTISGEGTGKTLVDFLNISSTELKSHVPSIKI